jgi:hypothetical protein
MHAHGEFTRKILRVKLYVLFVLSVDVRVMLNMEINQQIKTKLTHSRIRNIDNVFFMIDELLSYIFLLKINSY